MKKWVDDDFVWILAVEWQNGRFSQHFELRENIHTVYTKQIVGLSLTVAFEERERVQKKKSYYGHKNWTQKSLCNRSLDKHHKVHTYKSIQKPVVRTQVKLFLLSHYYSFNEGDFSNKHTLRYWSKDSIGV